MARLGIGLGAVLIVGVVLFLAIQLVPYGHDHSNPPVGAEPAWDSAATRAYAVTACFDCHSNETVWPWYSNIAPVSWLIQRDVEEGRETLNFSEWGSGGEGGEAAEAFAEGEMPPATYLLMDADARLSDVERAAFLQGLIATFGADN